MKSLVGTPTYCTVRDVLLDVLNKQLVLGIINLFIPKQNEENGKKQSNIEYFVHTNKRKVRAPVQSVQLLNLQNVWFQKRVYTHANWNGIWPNEPNKWYEACLLWWHEDLLRAKQNESEANRTGQQQQRQLGSTRLFSSNWTWQRAERNSTVVCGRIEPFESKNGQDLLPVASFVVKKIDALYYYNCYYFEP